MSHQGHHLCQKTCTCFWVHIAGAGKDELTRCKEGFSTHCKEGFSFIEGVVDDDDNPKESSATVDDIVDRMSEEMYHCLKGSPLKLKMQLMLMTLIWQMMEMTFLQS